MEGERKRERERERERENGMPTCTHVQCSSVIYKLLNHFFTFSNSKHSCLQPSSAVNEQCVLCSQNVSKTWQSTLGILHVHFSCMMYVFTYTYTV